MDELPRLTEREAQGLRLLVAGSTSSLLDRYVDCARLMAEKFEAAGLVTIWRESARPPARWHRVRLTDHGYEVAAELRRLGRGDPNRR